MRIKSVLSVLLIALLLALLAWPALRWLWQEWLTNETYSHGPLVPLISLFFAWRTARQRPAPAAVSSTAKTARGALPLTLISLGAVVWSAMAQANYLALLCLLPLISGVIWFLQGAQAARQYAFPVAYLAFAIPLPFIDQFTVPLQQWAAGAATALARLVGVPAAHEGSKILLTTCDLSVGAPCSGLRSLIALLALAAILAYLQEGAPWRRAILIPLAVPVALLTNILRILALLLVAERWGRSIALTLWHDWSGVFLFAVALGLLILLSRGIGCRTVRSDI